MSPEVLHMRFSNARAAEPFFYPHEEAANQPSLKILQGENEGNINALTNVSARHAADDSRSAKSSCFRPETQRALGDQSALSVTMTTPVPCPNVIHTVGPVARGHVGPTETNDLTSCYQNSLRLMKEHGLSTVCTLGYLCTVSVSGQTLGGGLLSEELTSHTVHGTEEMVNAGPLSWPQFDAFRKYLSLSYSWQRAVGWQLSAWTVTGSQTAFSGLPSDSQAALDVFCSHNTLALRRSSREATNCPLRKMLKAKWIGDECQLLPVLPINLQPALLQFTLTLNGMSPLFRWDVDEHTALLPSTRAALNCAALNDFPLLPKPQSTNLLPIMNYFNDIPNVIVMALTQEKKNVRECDPSNNQQVTTVACLLYHLMWVEIEVLTPVVSGRQCLLQLVLLYGGFPNEPAADIALNTVKSWIEENPDKSGAVSARRVFAADALTGASIIASLPRGQLKMQSLQKKGCALIQSSRQEQL
ncbi:hypothetical protein PAMP_001854 [Pampus punctatissimus]